MSELFRDIRVFHRVPGSTVVEWDLDPVQSRRLVGPLSFTLQASRSGVGDWTDVATATDTYFAVDPNRWIYSQDSRLSYRIRLEDGRGATQVSWQQMAYGNLPMSQRRLVAEILRKEYLMLDRFSGTCGWLFKLRHWGPRCTACTSPDTGEVVNASQCLLCYGTGILGGYFPPVKYVVGPAKSDSNKQKMQKTAERGVTNDIAFAFRAPACPRLDTGDVWVLAETDMRYMIQSYGTVEFNGIPIIYDPVETRAIPSTNIVYKLERPD